jgi:alanine racemase
VTMDQLMVDCGADAEVAVGDEAVLIGGAGPRAVTADDWADLLGTISYEILTGLGPRTPRQYVTGR